MKTTNHDCSGLTLAELVVVLVVLAALAGVILPLTDRTRTRSPQTRALSNAKQIGLACKIYAGDYGGRFPTAVLNEKGEVITPISSNEIFTQLFPDYIADKVLFFVPMDAYCSDLESADKNRLGAGQNGWGYVTNLTDNSNARFPLIATGTVPGTTHYTADEQKPGGKWKGKKAIVVRADISAAVENLDPKTLTIPMNEEGGDILKAGQKDWLEPNNVWLNPLLKAR